jgi:hypothetical protein
MRTHHVNPERYAKAVASERIAAVLFLRADCGTRSTQRAQVILSTEWAHVDCVRCLSHKPAEQVAQ